MLGFKVFTLVFLCQEISVGLSDWPKIDFTPPPPPSSSSSSSSSIQQSNHVQDAFYESDNHRQNEVFNEFTTSTTDFPTTFPQSSTSERHAMTTEAQKTEKIIYGNVAESDDNDGDDVDIETARIESLDAARTEQTATDVPLTTNSHVFIQEKVKRIFTNEEMESSGSGSGSAEQQSGDTIFEDSEDGDDDGILSEIYVDDVHRITEDPYTTADYYSSSSMVTPTTVAKTQEELPKTEADLNSNSILKVIREYEMMERIIYGNVAESDENDGGDDVDIETARIESLDVDGDIGLDVVITKFKNVAARTEQTVTDVPLTTNGHVSIQEKVKRIFTNEEIESSGSGGSAEFQFGDAIFEDSEDGDDVVSEIYVDDVHQITEVESKKLSEDVETFLGDLTSAYAHADHTSKKLKKKMMSI